MTDAEPVWCTVKLKLILPLTIDASGISGTHPIALATILGDGCRPTTAPLPIAQATRPVTAGAERIPIAVLPDRRDQALDRSAVAVHSHAIRRIPRFDHREQVAEARRRRRLAAMRAHLRDCGSAYLATSDIDLAIEWLKQHGVLRGGFTVQ